MNLPYSPNTTGTSSELRATVWLFEQGFEVFKNVAATGPADLVIRNKETGELRAVDVKTVTIYIKKDGSKSYNWSVSGSKKENVSYLGYCREEEIFLWWSK